MNIQYDTLMHDAREQAKQHHHKYIRTEHLLLALLAKDEMVADMPVSLDIACIRQSIAMMRCPTCDAEEKMELSASAQRAYELAQNIASSQPMKFQHLLYGILQSSSTVQRVLESCNVDMMHLAEWLKSEVVYDK